MDNPVFWVFFIHKYAILASFFLWIMGGIIINKYVVHIFINIFTDHDKFVQIIILYYYDDARVKSP